MSDEIWTIIGCGHGGQTFAGHMAILGKRVRLYGRNQIKIDEINKTKTITLCCAVNGVGKIEFATSDMAKAMDGATHIIIVLPSNFHKTVLHQLMPFLRNGQYVLLLPEASCGAIAFRQQMVDECCTAKIVLGAACSLPYATRAVKPGLCYVSGIKDEIKIAALPASDNDRLFAAFKGFPGFVKAKNVIETSIDNINAMMHPAPVLLNIARIEKEPQEEFEWYTEGMTPSLGILLEAIDAERIAVAAAYGIKQRTLKRNYIEMYGCGNDSMPLYRVIQSNKRYEGIKNIKSIRSRYILEDVPYSLIAIAALGDVAGVSTPNIDAVCLLYKSMLGDELDEGRTAESLGIAGMSKDRLLSMVGG